MSTIKELEKEIKELEKEHEQLGGQLEEKILKWERMYEAIKVLGEQVSENESNQYSLLKVMISRESGRKSMSFLDRVKDSRRYWQEMRENRNRLDELSDKNKSMIKKMRELGERYLGETGIAVLQHGHYALQNVTYYEKEIKPIEDRMEEIETEVGKLIEQVEQQHEEAA